MSEQAVIRVTELIGSSLCVSADDGQTIFDKTAKLINEDKRVVLSFERVTLLISLFLNVAIGQLYGKFDEKVVASHVKVEGLDETDREMLQKVIENAKKYYQGQSNRPSIWKEEGSDD